MKLHFFMLCIVVFSSLGAMEEKELIKTPTTAHLLVTGSSEALKKHLKKKKVSFWKRKKIMVRYEKQCDMKTHDEKPLLELGMELVQEANRKFYTAQEDTK
jgi:hypothetical protein